MSLPVLENRLQRTRRTAGDRWRYTFGNGLVVHTDPFMKADSARILPVGGPQSVSLNRLVNIPEIVAGKTVFDAFAGSGVLGLMALQLGAARVDFLDINPRARSFQLQNAELNGFAPFRYRALSVRSQTFNPRNRTTSCWRTLHSFPPRLVSQER
jgi:ribosomal protein L11 methylase PrmA